MPRLTGQDLELSSKACAVSESESSSKPVQSRNRTRNRVLAMDSLRIGIGTEFLDWTVSEPESESKKLEPRTSEPKLSKGLLVDLKMPKDGCWSTQNQYFLAESTKVSIANPKINADLLQLPSPHHCSKLCSQTSMYDTKTSSYFFNELLYKCWPFYEHRRPSWLVMPAMCNLHRKLFYFA